MQRSMISHEIWREYVWEKWNDIMDVEINYNTHSLRYYKQQENFLDFAKNRLKGNESY